MHDVAQGRLVESVAAHGAELGQLCRAHPGVAVRSCPDWSGADLLAHVTAFAVWLPGVFAGSTAVSSRLPEIGRADAVGGWDEALAGLVRTLRGTDARDPVPNWSISPDTAGFWVRRSAHEFAVHRWDAATLAGSSAPVDADLARDGIEEYFDTFVATALATGAAPAAEATIELELRDQGVTITRHLPHSGPVTRLRGTSSELFLAMWRRIDPVDMFVGGDRSLVEHWPRI